MLRSHDTKVRVQPGLHLFVLVRSTGAFYDALPIDEKFLAVARRVNGSAAITVKEGLRSAGGNRVQLEAHLGRWREVPWSRE